eukprot:Lankesteria_metandrocarpae@DN2313_c0_g1_i1.p1
MKINVDGGTHLLWAKYWIGVLVVVMMVLACKPATGQTGRESSVSQHCRSSSSTAASGAEGLSSATPEVHDLHRGSDGKLYAAAGSGDEPRPPSYGFTLLADHKGVSSGKERGRKWKNAVEQMTKGNPTDSVYVALTMSKFMKHVKQAEQGLRQMTLQDIRYGNKAAALALVDVLADREYDVLFMRTESDQEMAAADIASDSAEVNMHAQRLDPTGLMNIVNGSGKVKVQVHEWGRLSFLPVLSTPTRSVRSMGASWWTDS